MLITPVAVSLFAFVVLVGGVALFFAVERRVAAVEPETDPINR